MDQTRRDRLLLGLAAVLCALSVGIAALTRGNLTRLDSGYAGAELASMPGDGAFTALLLTDDAIPENRVVPLARLMQRSGGDAVVLRFRSGGTPEEDLAFARQLAKTLPGEKLLLSYGVSWPTALELLAQGEELDIASGVLLSPTGPDPDELPEIHRPLMLLGTSGDSEPSPQRLAELYNRLSGQRIAPNGLSFTSQSDGFRLRVVSSTVDAYQTFSPAVQSELAGWFSATSGARVTAPALDGALRTAGWVLGVAGVYLLLAAAHRLLRDRLLDVGYALIPTTVTLPGRFLAGKLLGWVPALLLLAGAALAVLVLQLPVSAPLPALFCGYLGALGGSSLLLYRFGLAPGVSGPLGNPRSRPGPRQAAAALGLTAAVLLVAAALEAAGLYTLRPVTPGRLVLLAVYGLLAAVGIGALLYDWLLIDQCKPAAALRLLAVLVPLLPYALLAFLAIPGYGFTGSAAVLFLAGVLGAALLLARVLRLLLGSFLLPAAAGGLLMGLAAALGSL